MGLPRGHENVGKCAAEGVAHGDSAGLTPQGVAEMEEVRREDEAEKGEEREVWPFRGGVPAEGFRHGLYPFLQWNVCVESLDIHCKEECVGVQGQGAKDGDQVA